MKIGTKLYSGFAVVILLTAVITILSLFYLDSVNKSIDKISYDRFPKVVWANDITNALRTNTEALQSIALLSDTNAIKEEFDLMALQTPIVTRLMDSLNRTIASEKGKELLKGMADSRNAYLEARQPVIKCINDGNMSEAAVLIATVLKKPSNNYIASVDELIKFQTDMVDEAAVEAGEMYSFSFFILVLIAVIAVIVSIVIALIITRGITGPLNQTVEAANKLAEGDTNVKLETKSKDETAILIQAMNNMANSISSMVGDANRLAEAAIAGKLDIRADASKYSGDYRNLIDSLNGTLDAIIGPLNLAAEFIDRISKGDIPPKVTDDYRGDFNEIKNNLNLLIDSMNGLIHEMISTTKMQVEGDIEAYANEDKFQGFYKDLIAGFNKGMDIHVRNILEILGLLNEYAEGDLSKEMPALPGKQIIATQRVNKLRQNVLNLIEDANALAKATVDGKLDIRADASKHFGDFRRIVDGINGSVDAIVGPLNVAAEYVDRISKGEIPPKITDDYKGDFNEIKNNLNGCIDGLQGLVEGRNVLAEVVVNDFSKKVRGNYLGIYAELANSINGIIDKLRGITALAVAIANGDLSEIETLRNEGKRSEQDELNPSLLTMMETIRELVEEAVYLARAGADGKLEVRGNASKFKGEYINVIEGFNQTLDNVIHPLNEAGEVLSIFASGDLTPRMLGDYKGDLAVYKENINGLGDSLSGVIREVLDAVQATASAAIQISSTSETMAVSAEEQSKQSDEVAGAVEEMARTVTENAMNAGKAAEVAEKNGDIANEGGSVVEQTVAKMRDIAGVVKQSAENIEKLGESSKQIGEIISVIDDIADQTNLLALNAAIEAARAGEQGRGFAVVADEVRKLAERTTEATKQIAGMIKGIQSETELAVAAMNQGTNEVADGISLADKAGDSLKSVVDSSRLVQDMINQIAAASEEQSSTSEQIAKNVGTISHVTNDSARRIQDIAHSSEDLSKLTEQLRTLVSQFKVDAEAGESQDRVSDSYRQLASSKKHLPA
ncbi:MAG: HAMP domain-containing protein [Ignavibacteria bacterium]|nr:HAMP domain-containing protein [Ignavibacteria bacterium]